MHFTSFTRLHFTKSQNLGDLIAMKSNLAKFPVFSPKEEMFQFCIAPRDLKLKLYKCNDYLFSHSLTFLAEQLYKWDLSFLFWFFFYSFCMKHKSKNHVKIYILYWLKVTDGCILPRSVAGKEMLARETLASF